MENLIRSCLRPNLYNVKSWYFMKLSVSNTVQFISNKINIKKDVIIEHIRSSVHLKYLTRALINFQSLFLSLLI